MFTGKSRSVKCIRFCQWQSQKNEDASLCFFHKRLCSVIISNIMIPMSANGKLRDKNPVQLKAPQRPPLRPMRRWIIAKNQIQSGHVHQVWEPVQENLHRIRKTGLYPILGNEKQSLCIKFCTGSYTTEHQKCLCKQSKCSWTTKGKTCPVSENEGNLLFDTHNLGSLRSIMREINIQNNGTINFTFQL